IEVTSAVTAIVLIEPRNSMTVLRVSDIEGRALLRLQLDGFSDWECAPADGMSAAAQKGLRHVPLAARLLGYIRSLTQKTGQYRFMARFDRSLRCPKMSEVGVKQKRRPYARSDATDPEWTKTWRYKIAPCRLGEWSRFAHTTFTETFKLRLVYRAS